MHVLEVDFQETVCQNYKYQFKLLKVIEDS